jgi:predicted nucleic acid-binding protein
MRILLDANILLRLVEPAHPHYAASRDGIELLEDRDHELILVPQVLYEFWAVATRPIANNGLGMTVPDALNQLTETKELFRLLRDERAIYEIWEQLVSSLEIKGKPAHDARLAAAMRRHGITHLLTFNTSDFARFSFVTAWDPIAVVAGAADV